MTDKWGRRLFKTGAVALILLGLVHSLSLLEHPVPANATEKQLLDLMSNYRFNLMGSVRSMNDLLRGFSVTFMLSVLGLGVLDLALCGERAGLLKRVALFNAIWLAVMTAVSLHYFFAAPTSFLVAGLIMFALAWLKLPANAAR
ncbi:MAG: LIC_13387 family protein [Terriglobales bacterium]